MFTWIANLEAKDWAIVVATFFGPIVAVQAQKVLEGWREREKTRRWVFATLMATRGARASYDHVRALNSIELTFYKGSRKDKVVINHWREYYGHLNRQVPAGPNAPAEIQAWTAAGDELLLNLLEALAAATGYALVRDEMRVGSYAPIAHGQVEQELTSVRQLALEVLRGQRNLGMDVRSFVAAAGPAE